MFSILARSLPLSHNIPFNLRLPSIARAVIYFIFAESVTDLDRNCSRPWIICIVHIKHIKRRTRIFKHLPPNTCNKYSLYPLQNQQNSPSGNFFPIIPISNNNDKKKKRTKCFAKLTITETWSSLKISIQTQQHPSFRFSRLDNDETVYP